MRVYEVTYTTSDYSSSTNTVVVAAPNAHKAVEAVGKKNSRFVRSSGSVKALSERFDNVLLVK